MLYKDKLLDGCVGLWSPLFGSFGYGLPDYSGYNNHGRLINMAPVNWSVFDGCRYVEYDGTNDYSLVKSGSILSGLSNWTIVAWVRVGSYTNISVGRAIYCERAAAGNDILKLDSFSTAAGTNKIFITYRNTAGSLTQVYSTNTFTSGSNTRIFCVARLINGNFSLFTNGSTTGLSRAGNDVLTDANKECRIGADPQSAAACWWGGVSTLALYNRAILDSELNKMYSMGYSCPWIFSSLRQAPRNILTSETGYINNIRNGKRFYALP